MKFENEINANEAASASNARLGSGKIIPKEMWKNFTYKLSEKIKKNLKEQH
jgi:hypothetical protein